MVRPLIGILTLLLCSQAALAELTVTVKPAQTIVTVTPEIVTQLETVDGEKIGEAVREVGPAAVRPATPAAVLSIKSDRDLSKSLVKIRSATAEAAKVSDSIYVVSKPGKHVLQVNVISDNPLQWDDQTVTVIVGNPEPEPLPPPDPEPTPDPHPGVAPIDGPGFRVLFVSETGEPMPADIEDAFFSKEITDYLNANCVKVDGQPDFRRVDPDTKFTDPNHRFAKALARPRASLPWLIISNGTTGYEGPFPGGKDATLALLKKLNVKPQAQEPASVVVTMHTLPGCAPCAVFLRDELPQLGDLNIRIVEGGAVSYPTFVIEADRKTITLGGHVSAAGLRSRIRELLSK